MKQRIRWIAGLGLCLGLAACLPHGDDDDDDESGDGASDGGGDDGGGTPGCGDGLVGVGEVCDGSALAGASCNSLGLGGGALRCATDCHAFDTAGCAAAGEAPMIVQLTTNVALLNPGGTLVISAIVTDPQGAADLIGGSLADPGGGTYGPFVAAGSAGSYQLTLTWEQIAAVRPITDVETRQFVASFFDQAAHRVNGTLSVALSLGTCTTTNDCDTCQTCAAGACVAPATPLCQSCDTTGLEEYQCLAQGGGVMCCRLPEGGRLLGPCPATGCAAGFVCIALEQGPPANLCLPDVGTCAASTCS